jgi:hypothetical protein
MEKDTLCGASYFVLAPDIIRQIKSRRMRWAGHVTGMGEGRNVYRVLVGKPEGKRPLGRPRRRWEVWLKMDLREIGWGGGGVDSLSSGQGSLAGCCECGDEPSGCGTTELGKLNTEASLTHTRKHTAPVISPLALSKCPVYLSIYLICFTENHFCLCIYPPTINFLWIV